MSRAATATLAASRGAGSGDADAARDAAHPDEPVLDLRHDLHALGSARSAITVVVPDPDLLDEERLFALQEAVVPGGRITFRTTETSRGARRRIERIVGHWLDGPPPTNGERFVRPRFVATNDGHTLVAFRAGGGATMGHFETLAATYRGEIPAHLVRHYRDRKLQRIGAAVAASGPRVLDIGCGVGLYAREVQRRFDADVTAVDASAGSVREARRAGDAHTHGVRFAAGDALRLPFAEGTFDVVYTINVCHHLKRGEQRRMLDEAARVLRPGGRLLVFEINTRNPLFRFYMRHVFPRTRDIDRGDEEFIDPRRLPIPDLLLRERVESYTFLPDFLPSWLTRLLRPVERGVEATPMRAWGIHYTATLRRREGLRP